MSRKLLPQFRMWDKTANKYFTHPAQVLKCLEQQHTGMFDHEANGSIFEMATGILTAGDRNPVFEGDIVEMHQFNHEGGDVIPSIQGIVEYNDEYGCFGLGIIKTSRGTEIEVGDWCPIVDFYGLHEESWTVLGNVHENPELLEVKP